VFGYQTLIEILRRKVFFDVRFLSLRPSRRTAAGPKVKKLGTLRWSADRVQTGRMSPAPRRLAAGCQLPDLDHDLLVGLFRARAARRTR